MNFDIRKRKLVTVPSPFPLCQDLEEKMGYLVGDVLIAAAFLSYTGPFLSNYRDDLVQKRWMAEVGKTFVILFY